MKIPETNGLIENIYKYVQTHIEIAKLEVEERVQETIKKLVIGAILVLSAGMLFMFSLLTLALFLNHVFKSEYLGFLAVTILLAIVVAYVFHLGKTLLKPDTITESIEEEAETVFQEN
ncbi:putative membrane protein YqjE [Arcicella rosea]|uniref:phage holin family protein n=1 Tax=Arcicella rosea TaxID=502909 RepID=UPI00345DEEB6|eukprot:GDKK01055553.1.p1 GENE.GDKK01055553.1~~GDKK01055553.1.p1  ORF type:complete len:118 (+),score=12.79 GDKK01055553.1:35-388(+)